jgi:hypothetical protein
MAHWVASSLGQPELTQRMFDGAYSPNKNIYLVRQILQIIKRLYQTSLSLPIFSPFQSSQLVQACQTTLTK